MDFHVVNFSGGVNDKLEPHLLNPTYSVRLDNAFIENGNITPTKCEKISSASNEGELRYQNGERSIVKWGGHYYWTDNTDGSLDSSLGYFGIGFPNFSPAGSDNGGGAGLDGSYRYFFTYESFDGFESAPFDVQPDDFFKVEGAFGSVNLTGLSDANKPISANRTNVYRTVANGSEFYFVGSFDVSLSFFVDTVSDESLLTRRRYDLTSLAKPRTKGFYLTERNGIFYMADEDRVYISNQSNPHGWDDLAYIVFDDKITGMKNFNNLILVFTRNRTYILGGTDINDISKQEIPDAQGVANWKTIQSVRNSPIWVSNDGLCVYQNIDGRSGRHVQILTESLTVLPRNPKASIVANDVYYLFYDDVTYAFDFKNGFKFSKINLLADWAYYDKDEDKLLFKRGSVHYEAFAGDVKEFYYLSPDFVMDDMQKTKQLGRIFIDCTKDLYFEIFIDGVLQHKYKSYHQSFDQRRHFLKANLRGKRIQVGMRSKGVLRGYKFEFEYKRF